VAGPDPRLQLTARLRREYAAEHLLLTDSGTDALVIALRVALDSSPAGAPIAIPAYSCFDVATAAVSTGAPLVVYDIDPDTLSPDLPSLARCLAEGARTVVVASLYGSSPNWAAITQLADAWHALVVEDAAQGHGASYAGRPLGTLAPMSVLSFGRGKGWTGACGGAVLLRAPGAWSDGPITMGPRTISQELLGLGAAASQWLLGRPSLYGYCALVPGLHLGETRYHPPRRIRPMRRSAATLLEETWAEAGEEADRRRASGEWYARALAQAPGVACVDPVPHSTPGWLRFPLLLERGLDGFADPHAATALGIATGYPRSLPQLPAVMEQLAPWCREQFWPGADALTARLVTLPTHSLLSFADRADLIRMIATYRAPLGDRSR
jgi:dTDP-4-amino-4,6-dideoxygalactose transaminase